jgi:hypothetical protein
MKAHGTNLGALCSLAFFVLGYPHQAGNSLAELQSRFDHEPSAVHKARMIEKLGDAQFEEARRAEKGGDNSTVGLTLEKYRDNVRAALEALKKEHPNAEKQPNGYRQLEIHVRKGIRETAESLLAAPEQFKPPLQLVRLDLIAIDDELLRLLFPQRPLNEKATPAPPEKQP